MPVRFTSFIAVLAFLSVGLTGSSFAGPKDNKELQTIARQVAAMIEDMNVLQLKIDDEISKRTFKLYIQKLDPRKIYFTAQDLEEFSKFETSIDDQVTKGNLEFVDLVSSRYKARVQERVEYILKTVLSQPVDFTLDESLSLDYETRSFAATVEEVQERLRKEVKSQLLSSKLGSPKLTLDELKAKVDRMYQRLLKQVQGQSEMAAVETYLDAMARAFDPHSDYMSPETEKEFMTQMSLRLAGIGASLREDGDGGIVIEEVLPGGPAARDGRLKKGDKIVGIASDGATSSLIDSDLWLMPLSEKVSLIRGKVGTQVLLRVVQPPQTTHVDLVLTRGELRIESAKAIGNVREVTSAASSKVYKIGQIYLPSFYRDFEECEKDPDTCLNAASDIRKILQSDEFKSAEMVVLDLRNNGGGALPTAIDITGMFIDVGPVVQVKHQDEVGVHSDRNKGVSFNGPVVVLQNGLSASASEIVAAALQDYGRALVVGTDSFGKATVQTVKEVGPQGLLKLIKTQKPSGAIKVTIQRFYRINGGMSPVVADIHLPAMSEVGLEREGAQPYAFPVTNIDPTGFDKVGKVTPEIVARVAKQSAERRAKSEAFAKFEREIAKAKQRSADKTVSLNEETRKKTGVVEDDKEDLEDSSFADLVPLIRPAKSSVGETAPANNVNFYNDELLQIAVDYLEALKQ